MYEECEGVEGEYECMDIQPLPEPVSDSIGKALEDLYRDGNLVEGRLLSV